MPRQKWPPIQADKILQNPWDDPQRKAALWFIQTLAVDNKAPRLPPSLVDRYKPSICWRDGVSVAWRRGHSWHCLPGLRANISISKSWFLKIASYVINWIEFYLRGRSFQVNVNRSLLQVAEAASAVPQGSALDTIIFCYQGQRRRRQPYDRPSNVCWWC